MQRPACGQCQRANLKCGGYGKPWIFVVSTQNDRPSGNAYQLSTTLGQGQQDIAQPTELTRSAYQSRYMGLFWETYLPHGRSLPPSIARSYSCGWTEVVQRLCLEDNSVQLALLANCLCTVGNRDGKPWMVVESLKLYGMAVRRLTTLLRNPNREKYDSLLLTAKLLGMFEVW